ncbi:MAG: 50S ribosomal protein L11 methyltransferase [Bacteroidota bacterium]
MDFVELKWQVQPDFSDILMAELAEIGYDSFVDTEDGLNAYITEDLFVEKALQDLVQKYQGMAAFHYQFGTLAKKNWNEEWEKSYEPIIVDDVCLVRASFHPEDNRYPYQIIITPKMSFGTGHHETTAMMLSSQLRTNHQGKAVLDVGCGTAILAIMAAKLGASQVTAFDIDEWPVENALENIALNHCNNIAVSQGTIADVNPAEKYDIILANINRNVLLQEIPVYASLLQPGGQLLVSGFYEQDIKDINQLAVQSGLTQADQQSRNQWACVIFQSG